MIRTTVRSFISYILLGMFMPALVMAEGTPDLLPPAMETVCDIESGAAYGLCNAYCEAMDCDSLTPSASSTACQKVLDKFTQFTGRTFPCELDCPPLYLENEFPTFKSVVSDPDQIMRCDLDFDTNEGGSKEIWLFIDDSQDSNFQAAAVTRSGMILQAGDETKQTRLSESQYDSCYTLLVNTAYSAQKDCVCVADVQANCPEYPPVE